MQWREDHAGVRHSGRQAMTAKLKYLLLLIVSLCYLNQLFFYTRLAKPLVLGDSVLPIGNYWFVNASGHLGSKGFETNLKLRHDEVSLYCGYGGFKVNVWP